MKTSRAFLEIFRVFHPCLVRFNDFQFLEEDLKEQFINSQQVSDNFDNEYKQMEEKYLNRQIA